MNQLPSLRQLTDLIEAGSKRSSLRVRGLLSDSDPIQRCFHELAASDGGGPDREVIETCWKGLASTSLFATLSGTLANELESKDCHRLQRNLLNRFAASQAALAAVRAGRDPNPDHLTQLFYWLGRARDGETASLPSCEFTRDPRWAPSQLLAEASRRLICLSPAPAGFSVDDLCYRRDVALLWLERTNLGDISRSAVEIAHTVYVPVAAVDTSRNDGFLLDLFLEQIAPDPELPDCAVLVEHPDLWNRLLGGEVAEAVREGWNACHFTTLCRWSLTPRDASRTRLTLKGRSHSGGAHAGFRFLAAGETYDRGVLIAAEVKVVERGKGSVASTPDRPQGRLDSQNRQFQLIQVGSIHQKLDAACAPNARIHTAFLAPGPEDDKNPRPESRYGEKLIVKTISCLDDAFPTASLSPVVSSYLEWVIHEHSKLRIWGVGTEGGRTPTVDLEQVYVALSGYQTSEGEWAATGRLMKQEADRRTELELRERFGGLQCDLKDLSDDDREQIQIRLSGDLLAFTERDRIAPGKFQSRSAEGPAAADKETREISLGEAFAKYRRLVILGDPGSGKTTLVRWMARQMASTLRRPVPADARGPRVLVPTRQVDPSRPDDANLFDLGPPRFPVLVRAAQFAEALRVSRDSRQEPPKLLDILTHPQWERRFPHDPSSGTSGIPASSTAKRIEEAILGNRAVLLIDGLDEVTTSADRKAIVAAIDDFLQLQVNSEGMPGETGGNQVVITSRVAGYWAAPISVEQVQMVFKIQPMRRISVEQFCHNWSRVAPNWHRETDDSGGRSATAEGLIAEIYDPKNPSRSNLAGNPLLLTVMAESFRRDDRLPQQRSELFQLTIGYLINEWHRDDRMDDRSQLSIDETWVVLGAVAAFIHQHRADNLLWDREAQSEIIRALENTDRPRNELKRVADRFLTTARENVGLLTEVGRGVWRFLHQNVQEYLAARHVMAEGPGSAALQILSRLDNPRWREPLLMGLGHASRVWPTRQFRELVDQILLADGAVGNELPRSHLLVLDAALEMEEVPEGLWERLSERLIAIYSAPTGIGRCPPLRSRIESAFEKIREYWPHSGLDRFLVSKLQQATTACGVAELIRSNVRCSAAVLSALYAARRFDSPQRGWVIDRTLQSIAQSTAAVTANPRETGSDSKTEADSPAATPAPPVREFPPALRLRKNLLFRRDVDWNDFFARHTEASRFVVALFGGLGDFDAPSVTTEYALRARLLQFGGSLVWDAKSDDPIYEMALWMDKGLKQKLIQAQTKPSFCPEFIYRDTFDPALSDLVWNYLCDLVDQPHHADATRRELAQYLAESWRDEARPNEQRIEAALGLTLLLGENSPDVVAARDWFISREDGRNEALRMRNALRDPVVRSTDYCIAGTKDILEKLSDQRLIDIVSALLDLHLAMGGIPVKVLDLAVATHPTASRYILAEQWAYWVAGCSDDNIYNFAVVLDTLGKQLTNEITQCFAYLHLSMNRRWDGHLGWPVESVPPKSENWFDNFVIALEAATAIPPRIHLAWIWTIAEALRPLLKPELTAELDAIVLSQPLTIIVEYDDTFTSTLETWQADYLFKKTERVIYPYLRARTWLRMIQVMPERRQELIERSCADAALAALGTEDKQVSRLQSALIYERLATDLVPEGRESFRIAVEMAFQLDSSNRVRSLTRLSRLCDPAERPVLLKDAIDVLRSIGNPEERAELLAELQAEWPLYPETSRELRRLAGELPSAELRARAQRKLAPVMGEVAGQTDDLENQVCWSTVLLGAELEDLCREFSPPAGLDAIWERVAHGDAGAFSRLCELGRIDGLALTYRAASVLSQLRGQSRHAELATILSLVRDPDPRASRLIEPWLQDPNPEIQLPTALLLAEGQVWRPEVVARLGDCLRAGNDRLRFRAAKACYFKWNARLARALGLETLLAVGRSQLRLTIQNVGAALAWSWFWQNVKHNDVAIFDELVRIADCDEHERQRAAHSVLSHMNSTSSAVSQRLIEKLPDASDETQKSLLISLRRLRCRYDESAVLNILRTRAGATQREAALVFVECGTSPATISELLPLVCDESFSVAVRSIVLTCLGGIAADYLVRFETQLAVFNSSDKSEEMKQDYLLKLLPQNGMNDLTSEVVDEVVETIHMAMERALQSTDSRMNDAGAQALAAVYLALEAREVPLRSRGRFPVSRDAYLARVGDPSRALFGLIDSERYTLWWSQKYKKMIEEAESFVNEHDSLLIPPLVETLHQELQAPLNRGGDLRLSGLVDISAHVAVCFPAQFNEQAAKYPYFGDNLAVIAGRLNGFPGRMGAITMLGVLRQPAGRAVAEAIRSGIRDVWPVQSATLEAVGRISQFSDEMVEVLLEELDNPSRLTAFTAARLLTSIGTSERASVEVRQRILSRMTTVASQETHDNEVFMLDENTSSDRWCIHHLGRLDDLLHKAMMEIGGLI